MTRTEREQGRQRRFSSYYDYSLMFLTIFLVCFGLIMIYSTSSYNASRHFNDPAYYLKRQGGFAIVGLIFMIIVSKIDYRIYIKKFPIIRVKPVTMLMILCVLLQVAVLIFAAATKGSKRWLELGPLRFQPSELSKIAVILFTAYIVNMAPRRMDKIWGFIRVLIYVMPVIALVVYADLSTGLVMVAIMFGVSFVSSRKKLYFIVVGLIGVALIAVVAVVAVSYRAERFEAWLNLETHDKGFQILQGIYAISSGGIFGRGLGESMQKLGFIPESHNDMIFTVVCEELGLIGAAAVIILFILMIWRLFIISINAPDLYGALITTGILIHISVQAILNIAVVTNSIPATGIPLPFISYGGSSLMVLLLELGIALSVSNQIKYER